MANINITIPDAVATRVINGFCNQHRYPNDPAETKQQFFKRKIIEFIKDSVKAGEAEQQVNTARQTVINDVDNNINLT